MFGFLAAAGSFKPAFTFKPKNYGFVYIRRTSHAVPVRFRFGSPAPCSCHRRTATPPANRQNYKVVLLFLQRNVGGICERYTLRFTVQVWGCGQRVGKDAIKRRRLRRFSANLNVLPLTLMPEVIWSLQGASAEELARPGHTHTHTALWLQQQALNLHNTPIYLHFKTWRRVNFKDGILRWADGN